MLGQLGGPVDHAPILSQISIVKTEQLLITCRTIVEITCRIVGLSSHFSISKEVKHLAQVLFDPGDLSFSVASHVRVLETSRVLESVCLSGLLTHRDDFLDTSFGVSSRQIALS